MAIMRIAQGVAASGTVSLASSTTTAATSGSGPSPKVIAGGFLAIAVGLAAAWGLNEWVDPKPFSPAEGVGIFALLYLFAQGIERLLEPLASLVGDPSQTTAARDDAVAAAIVSGTEDDAKTAANMQSAVDKKRANRAVGLWAAATLLAMLASAATGMYLLQIVGASDVPRVLELLVTGLAVGGGTKPLHDLIKNIEKKKEQAQDPPEAR